MTDASGGSIAFVHAPKTIDNDLVENDHTPGFISAAEFVAGAFLSVDLDFRALPGIYVAIVMGRHAGFLTAASAAWRLDGDSGPHLIYVPERAFSVPRFIDDVRATLDRHKRCIVAVSEGVSTEDGTALVERMVRPDKVERDAHGNVKLSGSDLNRAFERALAESLPGKRARVDALGYMPRGYVGAISKVDQQEAFDAGVHAVEAAAQGGGSVALQYDGQKTVLKIVPLSSVAAKTRHMPDDYLDEKGSGLSDKGMAYLKRLVPKKYEVGQAFRVGVTGNLASAFSDGRRHALSLAFHRKALRNLSHAKARAGCMPADILSRSRMTERRYRLRPGVCRMARTVCLKRGVPHDQQSSAPGPPGGRHSARRRHRLSGLRRARRELGDLGRRGPPLHRFRRRHRRAQYRPSPSQGDRGGPRRSSTASPTPPSRSCPTSPMSSFASG